MAWLNGAQEGCPACLQPLEDSGLGPGCSACGLSRTPSDRLWLRAELDTPAGFDVAAAQRLSDLDLQDHFWLRERSHLVERLLARIRSPNAAAWDNALELGCGTGRHLALLEGRCRRVSAVDGHSALLLAAQAASSRALLVQGDVCATGLRPSHFDLLMALDVIEHVDADQFLREARRLAKPGADFLLSAPAFASLWSEVDERAGHRCRYRLNQLQSELDRHGWKLAGYTHYQCLLFPLVFASRRWGGKTNAAAERRPSPRMDRWLGAINRLEVRWLSRWSLPFGSSLFVWAKAVPP